MRNLFERLDPRARLLIVVAAIAIIASTPPAVLWPFPIYAGLTLLLVLFGRASGSHLWWRCVAASPFILLAAGLLAFQAGLAPDGRPVGVPGAISVLFKGYSATLLIAFLTATTPLSEMLWALRKLGSPQSLNLILGMMYRYTSLLSEEWARLDRARLSRTTQPLGLARFPVYGHQFGTLILRSWDRADRVHAAMLARGFDGDWPVMEQRSFHTWDAVIVTIAVCLFLAARMVPLVGLAWSV